MGSIIITQEYGKEIPKAIGDYASNKQLELIHSGNVEEAKKWGEGGVYRVALHTLSSALATGSIEGAVAGGGTAIVIPKVDEYLKQQGYDEDTRKAVLIGLSAGVGGATGEVSGVANNINQTENNYLNHIENAKLAKLQQEKQRLLSRYSTRLSCLIDSDCKSQLDRLDYQIKELENLSEKRDKEFDTAYDNCRNGKGCQQFYYLHVTQRLQWNAEANTLFLKDRKNGNLNNNWDLMPDEQNIFHNFDKNGKPNLLPNGNYRYKKFVHKNGQLEVIVDTKDGILSADDYNRIVTNSTNAGSYNYYHPNNQQIGHKDYDVDPYIDFGSGKGDITTLENRRSVPIKSVFPSEVLFGELPPVVGMKGSIANNEAQKRINKALDSFEKEKK